MTTDQDISARVYLYIRVSTDKQEGQGWSLEAQEARARRWASAYPGLTIVDVITDPGESAKDLNRPGIQRVLADMDAGTVDGVLVLNLLRLTRSTGDWSWLMGRYFGPHVKRGQARQIFSVEDLIDTRTPIGRFILTVRIAAAQLEREETGIRTAGVLRHIQSKGVHLGQRPFGFRRDVCGDPNPEHRCDVCGKLVPDSAEQAILAAIRTRRAEGASLEALAAELNVQQVKGTKGGAWTATSVRRALARAA